MGRASCADSALAEEHREGPAVEARREARFERPPVETWRESVGSARRSRQYHWSVTSDMSDEKTPARVFEREDEGLLGEARRLTIVLLTLWTNGRLDGRAQVRQSRPLRRGRFRLGDPDSKLRLC